MTLSLLSTTPDGRYLYQCTCGALLERKHKTKKCPECAPENGLRGKTNHPLYGTWQQNFKFLWPDFVDFVKEALSVSPTPGTLPGPIWQIRGRIPGTTARPGNIQWIKQDVLALPTNPDPDAMDRHKQRLKSDPEFKRLWEQAHAEIVNPSADDSINILLSRLEKHFTLPSGLTADQLVDAEMKREEDAQEFAQELQIARDTRYIEKDSGSQTTTGQAIRFQLVPLLADRMKEHYSAGMKAQAGTNLHLVHDMQQKVDFWTMAHITVTITLDSLGRGTSFSTMESALYLAIGKAMEHQAYIETIKQETPDDFAKIEKYVLKNEVAGYDSKISQVKKSANIEFEWMTNQDCVKLGNWAWANLQSVTNWFETVKFWNKKISHSVYYVGLSEQGLQYAAVIMKAKLDSCIKMWPMVCPPKDWKADGKGEENRGGYLKYHWKTSRMIHGGGGTDGFETTPGQTALDAINHYQKQAFTINPFIYGVQKALISTTNHVGAFKSYEKDSWMDQNMPLIDPAVWDLPKVVSENGHRNDHPDKRAAKKQLRNAHKERKLAEKQRQAPETVLQVAARFLNVERFYLPMYFDYRLRMYYQVDTLNPQGSDYQKALIMFADGTQVTDANREIVRRDLLVTMANSWSGKVEGRTIKSDKLSLSDRVEYARKLVEEGAQAAADPISSEGRAFWTSADEPFQFLAALREYYEIFILGTRNVAQVANGRDASNSGMQVQGGLLRDEVMCTYTNVTPQDEPRDAYELVAEHAREVLLDKEWMAAQMEKAAKRIEKADADRLAEDPDYKPDTSRRKLTVTPEHITRKVCKRPVMCTGYGASWQSKNEYVSEELEDLYLKLYGADGQKPTMMDKVITTNAVIQGQRLAFPRQDSINQWFKAVGKACLERGQDRVVWETAAGSKAVQEYREPVYVQVDTYGMGGARYREVLQDTNGIRKEGIHRVSVRTGWGKVIESKTESALAANWTHSQDASIIQLAADEFKDFSTYVVHDCAYCPAGSVDEMVRGLKVSYLRVVGPDFLEDLNTQNGTDVPRPEMGEVDVVKCLKADYMFA